ncbi:MAG: hypothetical protein OEW98_10910 [Betaproteobacteria bacterium]|nr:hypothetical protein [Betaproteobacteria bacterium]
MKLSIRPVLLLCLALSGATAVAEPQNSPAANPFAGHDRYRLALIAMDAPCAGHGGDEKAKAKIQEYLNKETLVIVQRWNGDAQGSQKGVTFSIEPRVEKIKFIGGAARFWAGALAGDSYGVIKVRFVEKPGDKVPAEPEFYQRAAAMSGAWTFGAQDDDMLHRIIVLAIHYLEAS